MYPPGFGPPPPGAEIGPYTCPIPILEPCKDCHDGRGTAGTPMGLMTFEDYHAPAASNPSVPVYKLLPTRLRATSPNPMPPDGMLDAALLTAIDSWVNVGGPDCGFAHVPGYVPPSGAGGGSSYGTGGVSSGGGGIPNYGGAPPQGGAPPIGGSGPGPGPGPNPSGIDPTPYLSPDGTFFIKEPPGDKPLGPDAPNADFCFNIVAHGAQQPLPQDPSPYSVRASEYYHAFHYTVPYNQPFWTLSTKPIIDNNRVLHHWLLFRMGARAVDGTHQDNIGLQIGNELLTGWAPGGNPLDMPEGVGLEMPPPGTSLLMETHYNNTTGGAQPDRSGVRVCGTYTPPQNVATMTWLGTEIINVPARAEGSAAGTCTSWQGRGGNQEVHIFQTVPHMHRIGSHMRSVVNRAGGGTEVIVDKPFVFSDQRAYAVDVKVRPGDTITTTCTFQNDTSGSIGFGTGTEQEMCYNFVIYYPARALNGIGGIEGSNNMCLF